MICTMPTLGELVSDAKSRLNSEQYKDAKTVEACEKNAKLTYYQTLLDHTDYIPLKIVEGVATKEDYADILKARDNARKQIDLLIK
ncbi:MAG TPA: hypothetical protein DG942_02130 [Ruminococcaceae bacterium]|nr:hypothetical protein [Oscillospiraceae bacterium]